MSGHSKWASIKHKKAATDAKRGKQFTKLARAITVAAREGGGDPDGNPTLATAIQKARDASMPKDNIQRAVDRGTGAGAGAEAIERVLYEGYGPGGAAILVEALTDNRNRSGSEIRHAFEKRGVLLVDGERYTEDDLISAVDAGADDVGTDGDLLKVISDPSDLPAVREALEAEGIEVTSSEIAMDPKTVVEITDESEVRRLVGLMEALDDHDDVDAVHANFDIPERLLEEAVA